MSHSWWIADRRLWNCGRQPQHYLSETPTSCCDSCPWVWVGPRDTLPWIEYDKLKGRSFQRFRYQKTVASPFSLWRKPTAMLWAALWRAPHGEALRVAPGRPPWGTESCQWPWKWLWKNTRPQGSLQMRPALGFQAVWKAVPRFPIHRNLRGNKCVWFYASGFGDAAIDNEYKDQT